jgi:hypothetical protein
MTRQHLQRAVTACIAWCALAPATNAADPPAKPSTAPSGERTTKVAPAKVADAQPAVDRLQLDSTSITGNRELPKVMSIVPWKSAEPPAGPDRPMGSLIDELLSPLDRDEFRREIAYYRDLTSQSAPVSADPHVPGVTKP